MSEALFVVNAGSSSIKFKLYRTLGDDIAPLIAGALDGIGTQPRLKAKNADGAVLVDQGFAAQEIARPSDAQHAIGDWVTPLIGDYHLIGVGHRVVHGGPDLAAPVLVDDVVLEKLRALSDLAPLHQPHNLAGIEAARRRFPGVPQIACFDTAFHRNHPWEADTFGLPPEYYARGIRRYGFHGLSYEYIASLLAHEDPALAAGRVVVAHLGNGASLCAIRGGRSMDSTMGFTAVDGVPMGTRSGQIDPGVLLHLMLHEDMSVEQVGTLIYQNAGLKGMSGISQDVRELSSSPKPEAAAALRYFAYRVRREIGALSAVLGGIDALVFTAGIGENARALRAQICEGLDYLGIAIDPARNEANERTISPDGARVPVLVRATDEEKIIAQHVIDLLGRSPTLAPSPAAQETV